MKHKSKKIIMIIFMVIVIVIVILASVITSLISNSKDDEYSNSTQQLSDHLSVVPDGYIGIYTVEDLQKVELNTSANYILMSDIDLSNADISPLETYSGAFDGNNYAIKNYHSNYPLFKIIDSAVIKNLHFLDATIDQRDTDSENICIGGIIGKDNFNSANSISNCTYQGDIIIYGDSNQLSPSETIDVGGIIGRCSNETYIENCTFNGTIDVLDGFVDSVGGIVGDLKNNGFGISGCYSLGEISTYESSDIGGICGYSESDVHDCYSACTINVNFEVENIGGLVGTLSDGFKIYNAYFSGKIESAAKYFGAIAGKVYNTSNIVNQLQYCYYNSENLNTTGDGTPYANVQLLSDDDMRNKKNFIGFDFNSVWEMGTGDYPYPVLINSFYKFSDSNINKVDANEANNNTFNVSDISYAFEQSVKKNSYDEIKPYVYPKAQEILDSAYAMGEDNSALVEMNCVLEDFYYDPEYPLGSDIELKGGYSSFTNDEFAGYIKDDLTKIDPSIKYKSILFEEYEYSNNDFDSSCMLIILDTEDGAYLLGISY